jgi:ADP-ribosylation factor family
VRYKSNLDVCCHVIILYRSCFDLANLPSINATTVGSNLAKLEMYGAKYHISDVGGRLQDLWERYYDNCDAVIFCWKLGEDPYKPSLHEDDDSIRQNSPYHQSGVIALTISRLGKYIELVPLPTQMSLLCQQLQLFLPTQNFPTEPKVRTVPTEPTVQNVST